MFVMCENIICDIHINREVLSGLDHEQTHPYTVRVRNVGVRPHNHMGIRALAGHPEQIVPTSAG